MGRHSDPWRLTLAVIILGGVATLDLCAGRVMPGDDLQAVLDRGEDLALEPGEVYEVGAPLRFMADGQAIHTRGAVSLDEFATLRLSNADNPQLIHGNAMDDIVLERVVLDGNRSRLCDLPSGHPRRGEPLVMFGGAGAKRQTVRSCLLMSARTWSTLKLHEEGSGLVARDNLILGAGTDPRGNGRADGEKPFSWGDGISCAAAGSLIENNLVIDATDVGIVVFGAPGTKVRGNVVATVSRETLGGINMVDALEYYAVEGRGYSYEGTRIEENWIDAFGGRIHIAVPMGASPWVPHSAHRVLFGGIVRNNRLTGGAAGYGFVAHGIDDFVIEGNTADATFSGLGDGLGPTRRPVMPEAFLHDSGTIGSSRLQPDFKAADGRLEHLLRCNHGPTGDDGYRIDPYGEDELAAVVRAAYLEMLAREPRPEEARRWMETMAAGTVRADSLRRSLMSTPEFEKLHGEIDPDRMQAFRLALWRQLLRQALGGDALSGMDARATYRAAKQRLADRDFRKGLDLKGGP